MPVQNYKGSYEHTHTHKCTSMCLGYLTTVRLPLCTLPISFVSGPDLGPVCLCVWGLTSLYRPPCPPRKSLLITAEAVSAEDFTTFTQFEVPGCPRKQASETQNTTNRKLQSPGAFSLLNMDKVSAN